MLTATVAWLAILSGCEGGAEDPGGTPIEREELDQITTNVRPSKRSEVRAAVSRSTGSIMIFGGNDGPVVNQFPSPQYLNDTWVFQPGTGWTEATGETRPRKRSRYAVAVDERRNRALLFGGRFRQEGASGDYRLFNDLWEFDFLTRTWRELDGGSGRGKPSPRYYGQGAYDASTDTFYVWGGNVNTSALVFEITEELWAWTDEGGWALLETSGRAPSQRSFLDSAHDTARNELVVFGGQRGDLSSQAYNDTYSLSLETFRWERLHNGRRGQAPSTRMHAPLLYDPTGDRYILFGGHTDVGDQNDLWSFDPEERVWSELRFADELHPEVGFGCLGNATEVPADYVSMDLSAPERRHNGMVGLLWDSIWVFGGWHAECSDHLDDTWRFDLRTEEWVELWEAQTGESCLRANQDCECLCL